MSSHNQDPSQLSYRIDRRRKFAAWATGLSLFGGALFETARPQPASAMPESSQQAEQTPRVFINDVDKKLVQLEARLKSAQGVKTFDDHRVKQLNAPEGVHTYLLAEPSKTRANRYDYLAMIVRKGEGMPLTTVVTLGAASKKYPDTNTSADKVLIMNQSTTEYEFMPESIELLLGTENSLVRYCAASTNYDGNHPPFGKTTSVNYAPVSSSVVSKQFDSFFERANEILSSS